MCMNVCVCSCVCIVHMCVEAKNFVNTYWFIGHFIKRNKSGQM